MKNYKADAAVIILQIILIFYTFGNIIQAPSDYLFCNTYDGFKNYLTFSAYTQQETFDLNYHQMNYPYGDEIVFTDNTPVLAVLYKSFSTVFPFLAAKSIAFYNIFCLLSILFSALILFRIFRLLSVPLLIAFVLANILPWTTPQFERLFSGHLNLSFSWVILSGIFLLLKYYQSATTEFENKQNFFLLLAWIFFLPFITFIHVYYLAIVGLMAGVFAGCWFLKDVFEYKSLKKSSGILLLTIIIAGILAFSILVFSDTKSALRQTFAEGYGFEEWKLSFRALYRSPDEIPFRSLIGWQIRAVSYESYMYLGIVFWATLISFLFSFKKTTPSKKPTPLLLLIFTGIICLSVALGEDGSYLKWVNPFYYLHFFTDRVEQFRCISRFAWVFFWVGNITAAYWLGKMYSSGNWLKISTIIILLFGVSEVYFVLKNAQNKTVVNLLSPKIYQSKVDALLKNIPLNHYQAILPVPYYHVGCENYDYTIDPEEDFFIYSTWVSLASNLPNMGSKMSRTPVIEAQSLLSIFDPKIGQMAYLQQHINSQKPILVLLDKEFYANISSKKLPERTIPAAVLKQGLAFTEDLILIKSLGRYALYEYSLPVSKNFGRAPNASQRGRRIPGSAIAAAPAP